MVVPPDDYMMQRRFLAALREPLRCKVLTQGDTAEFHTLEQLVDTASKVEDTVRYMGTQMIDALGGT